MPRPLQVQIGKKLWRIRLVDDLAGARRQAIGCPSTDEEIELAKLLTEEDSCAKRKELLHLSLQGMDPEDIFDHPKFYGSPKEAKVLSVLPKTSGQTAQDILELVIGLKKPAEGTIKEYKGCLEKFCQHCGNDYLLGADTEAASDFRTHLLSKYKTSTAKKTIR